jgi:agmatinase
VTSFDDNHGWAHLSRGSFAGIPVRPADDVGEARVAILGAPIDWGTTYRPGARFGPRAIRHTDYLPFDGRRPHVVTGLDALEVLGVVDVGDVELMLDPEAQIALLADTVEGLSRAGAVPIVLGGDHSITFPNATGVTRVHGPGEVALVHFDAHADTGDIAGPLYAHGAPMRRLIESGAVPGHRFAQIGLRGYWPGPETVDWMRDQGIRSHFMTEISERGLDPVIDDALNYTADAAAGVFLSVDIDVVDPGMAPGTGTPEPGGLTSRQLLDAVRRIARETNIVGADVVEVSPPYDGPGEITAFLASRVVLEVLNGMAERHVGHT